jgi:hypothetical protein
MKNAIRLFLDNRQELEDGLLQLPDFPEEHIHNLGVSYDDRAKVGLGQRHDIFGSSGQRLIFGWSPPEAGRRLLCIPSTSDAT